MAQLFFGSRVRSSITRIGPEIKPLWNELHPKNKLKAGHFFTVDLDVLQHAAGRPEQAQGDLEQVIEIKPDNKHKAEAKTSD